MILSQLVLNHLVFNEPFMRQSLPHLRAEYFESLGEQHVFGLIDEFINEYGSQPTPETLVAKLERTTLSEGVYKEAIEATLNLEPGLENIDWMLNETEEWAKDRALYNAVRLASKVYAGESEVTPGQLQDVFGDVQNIKFSEDLGHFYWEAAAEHFDKMHEGKNKIPFLIEIMNMITRGGLEPKTLNVVLAGINVGKTTWLIDRACEQVEQGKNVIYFTLEVDQNKIRHRSDARMLNIDFDRLENLSKQEYLGYVSKKKRSTDGVFVIKEYPSGTAHAGHFRNHIKEIERQRGIKFDMIVIDYITEAISSRLPIHMMSNSNTYFGSVAREFRALAHEFEVPVWTAMQLTRDKQDGLDSSVSDTADSITIPKIADFMFSLGMSNEDAMLKQAYATQMKNRYADKNKMRNFRIGLDNDRQIFFDVPSEMQEGVMTDELIHEIKNKKKGLVQSKDNPQSYKNSDSVNNWNFEQ